MRPVPVVTGVLIIVIGSVAAITGNFDGLGLWLFALGLGAIGVAGLVSALVDSVGSS